MTIEQRKMLVQSIYSRWHDAYSSRRTTRSLVPVLAASPYYMPSGYSSYDLGFALRMGKPGGRPLLSMGNQIVVLVRGERRVSLPRKVDTTSAGHICKLNE